MTSLKKRVVIVEDNHELRKSYEIIVNGSGKFSVTGAFDTFEEAYRFIGKNLPDIVLMDVDLPGKSGIEGVRVLREKHPHVESVMVTVYEDDEVVFEALKAGASGYITKSANHIELIEALEEIMRGGAPMSSRIARMVVNNYHVNLNSPLTSRERQILHMLSVGKTYSQIAEELNIAKETSKTHIRNIYAKLEVNSKSDAIAKANHERII